ncbi:MAG: T9SS type A sorting domain-containing protein [Flavobacteriales bacterium]|nr:T9SS type A sorting domain-containing protein [Flavobacteriales bacterium]
MNKISTILSTLFAFFGLIAGANAQCAAGEVAVTADVTTDTWGYELYWEITPDGDDCGVNTIAFFGNPGVGCAGGAAQTAGGGDAGAYPANETTSEDLGCMTSGVCVNIYTVDDWGDGSSSIQLYVDGIVADLISCTGAGDTTSFCPTAPASFDASASVGPGVEYTIAPLSQVAPIGGSATIVNSGGGDITNATVTSNVTDGAGNVVYTETSAPVATIAVGATADVSVAGYTPTMVDTYTIEYVVSITEADGDVTNDAVQSAFVVSDSIYARDNGIADGSLGIGSADGGQLGQSFSVSALDTMTSVSMQISNASGDMTGLPISATIYDTDPVTGAPVNVLATTEIVLVDATPDSMYTCVITNGLELAPGTYAVVANEADSTIGLATSSSIYTEGATWVIFGTNDWANSEDYGFDVAYLLRPNFGSVVESTVGLSENSSANVSIYPNPSTGNFNLNMSGLTASTVDVNITDVSGKVVMNTSFNTVNGGLNAPINISNVEEGVYIVRVNGDSSIVKRIVVSKK